MSYKTRMTALALAAFLAGTAQAQFPGAPGGKKGDDSNKPIEITADQLEVFQDKHQAIFTGKVVAVQGETTINADKMVVLYRAPDDKAAATPPAKDAQAAGGDAQRIQQVDVEGNVLISTPKENARGQRGSYFVEQKVMRLYGDVVLTQGQNVLKGSALEYNTATGYSRVVSGGSPAANGAKGGRVKGLFVPQ
ncbi:lipopolysaccharide transport periplasmic protein LptA [bacterium]|nr:lipopolysaccharide transport periplasmic protein LptA [bacterium]